MIELDTIYNQNCVDGLKLLPDKSIDLILTDPPYGKKADKGTNGFGAAKNRRYAGGWDKEAPPKRYSMRCSELQKSDHLWRELFWKSVTTIKLLDILGQERRYCLSKPFCGW